VTRRTVRVRLTALYCGLFLAASTILLIVVNLLLQGMLADRVDGIRGPQPPPRPAVSPPSAPSVPSGLSAPPGPPAPPGTPSVETIQAVTDLRDAVLTFQWSVTAVTIAVLAVVSVAAGWWLAGRVLRPLHRITATARRLSLSNLHEERIALAGPRDELKELADTFDSMLERLERSVAGQRRFVANASHELRTPLAVQRAAIQIGLEDPSPERLAEVREELLAANRRTERLIDGLLILARDEDGLDTAEPVALHSLVRRVAGETAAAARARTRDGGEDPPRPALDLAPVTVSGDPVLLGRLVANLIDNALRYNRPGGSVAVALSEAGVLTVRNTGPEVPAECIDELFEPFRRLRTARTRSAEGTGLGLSIVASIARAHGATVGARPGPDGGLAVTARFSPSNA
jgi:signal transduction histidine kinase